MWLIYKYYILTQSKFTTQGTVYNYQFKSVESKNTYTVDYSILLCNTWRKLVYRLKLKTIDMILSSSSSFISFFFFFYRLIEFRHWSSKVWILSLIVCHWVDIPYAQKIVCKFYVRFWLFIFNILSIYRNIFTMITQ